MAGWRSKGIAVTLAVVVSASVWWVYSETNVLASGDFCGGLVEQDDVQAVLEHDGRLSASGNLESVFSQCVISGKGFFPPGMSSSATLRIRTAGAGYPIWRESIAVDTGHSLFDGVFFGAVTASGGWIVFPSQCEDWESVVGRDIGRDELTLQVFIDHPAGGEDATDSTIDLLTAVGQRLSEMAGCPAVEQGSYTLSALGGSGPVQTLDPESVCGIEGFTLPEDADPRYEGETLEQRVRNEAGVWLCDIWLPGDDIPDITAAVVQNNSLIDTIRTAGTEVEPCDRIPTYLTTSESKEYRDRTMFKDTEEYPSVVFQGALEESVREVLGCDS